MGRMLESLDARIAKAVQDLSVCKDEETYLRGKRDAFVEARGIVAASLKWWSFADGEQPPTSVPVLLWNKLMEEMAVGTMLRNRNGDLYWKVEAKSWGEISFFATFSDFAIIELSSPERK